MEIGARGEHLLADQQIVHRRGQQGGAGGIGGAAEARHPQARRRLGQPQPLGTKAANHGGAQWPLPGCRGVRARAVGQRLRPIELHLASDVALGVSSLGSCLVQHRLRRRQDGGVTHRAQGGLICGGGTAGHIVEQGEAHEALEGGIAAEAARSDGHVNRLAALSPLADESLQPAVGGDGPQGDAPAALGAQREGHKHGQKHQQYSEGSDVDRVGQRAAGAAE